MTEQSHNDTFYVGLCMAGAISAGAYTAGVMDYLIEALDDWERRKKEAGIPQHKVVVPVIGGASAGGMTAIVTASAMNNRIHHLARVDPDNLLRNHSENKFYHSWVDLTTADVFHEMLDTQDIQKGQISSLLNSRFIEEIANRAIGIDKSDRYPRPYLAPHMKIFVTLSNLKGFWYDLFFRGTQGRHSSYFIHRHNDYARFKLNSTIYTGDGWIPLDFYSDTSLDVARDAAMATGAFPVGLQARRITRNAQHVNDIEWLRDTFGKNPLPEGVYESLNVDGGMINNEPFENVRNVLKEVTGQEDPQAFNSFNHFRSTILMVDPFPGVEPDYDPKNTLLEVAGSTLAALINQSRVKPDAILEALDDDCAGQFLIAPTRNVPQLNGSQSTKETGSRAIACGAFAGFSGFFNKEFRIHDYFLGRANCEKFLRDHFTVPESTENLVTRGYASLSPEQRERFYSVAEPRERKLPIIPILTERSKKYLPVFSSGSDWPVMSLAALEKFRRPMKTRTEALIMNLANYNTFTWLALAAGSRIILRRKITSAVMNAMKSSLAEHQLMRMQSR